MKSITLPETRLQLQGDKVLVTSGDETAVLTITHLIDFDKRELMLSDREHKDGEQFPFTQDMANMLVPFKDPKNKDPLIKWKLSL